MLSFTELNRVLDLHEKAYQLFCWLTQRFREKNPPFEKLTEAVMRADEAQLWMKKNIKSFPSTLQIQPDDLETLSHLFTSFLSTSYEVASGYVASSHGCGPTCGYCSHWLVGTHLRRRNVTAKDRESAASLKKIYLQQLAVDQNIKVRAAAILSCGRR